MHLNEDGNIVEGSERWVPVFGYEGLYEISDRGSVRSVSSVDILGRSRRPRLLAIHCNTRGRPSVALTRQRKKATLTVHRLVLLSFVGPPEDSLFEVNHKDGNKLNNRLDNLEWCSRRDNHKHARSLGLMVPPKGEVNGHSLS